MRFRDIKETCTSVFIWLSALIAFIPFGLFIIILHPLIDLKKVDSMIKAWARFMIRLSHIRVRVEGAEYFKQDKTYLYMSNHVNLFDGFLLYGYIPNYMCGIELDTHFKWPFYGAIIRRLGNIPISRTHPRQALKSLKIARDIIAEGRSVVILPEGGRTLTGQFKTFKRGAFFLARQAGVDIVPMVIIGAYSINHKGTLQVHPGQVTLRVGEPIPYSHIQDMDIDEIKTLVHHRMLDLFE